MARARKACCAFVVAGALLGGALPGEAAAGSVTVLFGDGRTRVEPDLAPQAEFPAAAPVAQRRPGAPRARAAARRTVGGELLRLLGAGQIDYFEYGDYRATFRDARRFARRLSGARRLNMHGVLGLLDGMAARGALTPSRLVPLREMVAANRQWWSEGPLLASGARVRFAGSELVWQYFPGQGIQFHPLANFGRLNALWRERDVGAMSRMIDELLPLAAERAGGVAWEYYFRFGFGAPPWVSGMAQGTGLQSLVRAGRRTGRLAEVLPVTERGLTIFEQGPPAGVRVGSLARGPHYLLYSFDPGLRVINGYLQSLVGLHDYGRLAPNRRATTLFDAGDRHARRTLPSFDTGAWSLYSRGRVQHESSLGYHTLVRDFLDSLCDRTGDPVYCETLARFTRYLGEPPAVRVRTERLRGARTGALRFALSKISYVRLEMWRGRRLLWSRSAGLLPYGERGVSWWAPRRAGTYELRVSATDLAGNDSAVSAPVRVLRPRR